MKTAKTSEKPKYSTPECDRCKFLGTIDSSGAFDVYLCHNPHKKETNVFIRVSNTGSNDVEEPVSKFLQNLNTNNGNCWRTKAATLVFQRAYRAVPRLCYEHEDCTANEELSRACLQRKNED